MATRTANPLNAMLSSASARAASSSAFLHTVPAGAGNGPSCKLMVPPGARLTPAVHPRPEF